MTLLEILQDGSTPLMIAAYKGYIDILKKYMKAAMPEINSQKEVAYLIISPRKLHVGIPFFRMVVQLYIWQLIKVELMW